ncbi:hypothetical protein FPV67DRAFT_1501810 [Lyophyllum atratum]|nr:hypothetical protein FPV67DRAFT_1501810 [Lyophyllum atratum]
MSRASRAREQERSCSGWYITILQLLQAYSSLLFIMQDRREHYNCMRVVERGPSMLFNVEKGMAEIQGGAVQRHFEASCPVSQMTPVEIQITYIFVALPACSSFSIRHFSKVQNMES